MDFLSNHKKTVFFIIAIICVVSCVLTLNYKKPTFVENFVGYIVSPSQKVTNNIGDWFTNKIDLISNLDELEASNQKLLDEIERLKFDAARVDLLEKELQRFESLYELNSKYPDLPKIGAEITSKDSNNWSARFNIDKGTKDGLAENMVILADGGLVGRIFKAGYNYSQVIPITDDTSSVGAQTKRSGDFGFVKGDLTLSGNGYCRMENIDLDAEILENDEIITSNLGNVYPPGLTIGYVKEVHVEIDGLTKYAIIIPVVDFKHLDTVLVVNKSYVKTYEENPAETDSPESTGEPEPDE